MDQLNKVKKRILLTGSNGFLGHKLTELILKDPEVILMCTSASNNRNPRNQGYQFCRLDLKDLTGLARLVEDFSPTHIIHTAAISSVEACENDPKSCHEINVDAPKFLAELSKKHNIHLTFLSTDFVFDGKNGPYQETDECNPLNAYGESKLKAENEIISSGCRVAILRTILVYGVIADKKRSNLILWAKNKLESNEPIRVVSNQWRMPTWVDDLAQACLSASEKKAQGIFHVSSEKMYSILEIVQEVADYWNLNKSLISPVTALEIGQAANRPTKTGFIISKAQQELGFTPTPLTESLGQIDLQLKNLSK